MKYIKKDAKIKIKDGCVIGVGYNMCTDISFSAVDLINKLEPMILEMEEKEGKAVTP